MPCPQYCYQTVSLHKSNMNAGPLREADPLSSPGALAEPLLGIASTSDTCSHEPEESSSSSAVASANAASSTGASLHPATATAPSSRRNINLILLYTVLMFGGRSMWSQTVLSAYVFLLRNEDPESVGVLTAIMGICQLIFSFPAGYLADKFRRDRLLKVGSLAGIVAISATIVALNQGTYWLLAVALALWGGFWGIVYTCISALFADSMRDGDRSLWFTRRMILIKLGNMGGPVVALLMFLILGDSWSIQECAAVMTCGQALCAVPVILLCFVSDDGSVAESDPEDNAISPLSDNTNIFPPAGGDTDNDASNINVRNHDNERQPQSRSCFCLSKQRYVPAMVAAADIISGVAAGMSIRYFPIFFLSNLELGPVIVQVLFLLSVGLQVPISVFAQWGAKHIGRCEMTVVFKWIGIALFISMIVSFKLKLPVAVTCIFWIGRTACMNGTSALTKSIIMDEVPKKERARWAALESVNMFSWSGSAALGGVLVKVEGILFNFCVTSALQLVATIPLMALFGKVRDEGARSTEAQTSQPPSELSCEEARHSRISSTK
mmetsp:Transcript_17540/g.38107  ORF Transcript_17540/g.38107 Transcript_17540/m.38107 type:complete len:553 (-) Transcript_17540:33-1691(-)